MNIQDLSLEELKICELLHTTVDSILRPLEAILCSGLGVSNLKIEDIQLQRNATILKSWWGETIYYTAPQVTIQSLVDKGLLSPQGAGDQKFYTLNKSRGLKKFFKELEIQIALGSIHYDAPV